MARRYVSSPADSATASGFPKDAGPVTSRYRARNEIAGRPSISLTTPDPERVTVPVAPIVRQPVPSAVEWAMGPEKSSTATPSSETRSAQNWNEGREAANE